MTTTMIGRQERCCHLTLRTFWSRLILLRNMPSSQTRTRSLIFRRCALVQNPPVPDENDDNSVDKNAEPETKCQRIILAAALYSYYSTLDDEGDEIDWDQLSDEEFESEMEKLKVRARKQITDIALRRYKDLAFRACDKSNSNCRPLVNYSPVDVFRAERGGISTQIAYLSHQKKN
jgi:hypothetical protein